jgi:flagellar assembly protein FliH
MSSKAWQPPVISGKSFSAPRVARIVNPAMETEVKPMEWRELGAPRRETPSTGGAPGTGKPEPPSPDITAQLDAMRMQCEQKVREAHAAGVREAEAAARTKAMAEVQATLAQMAQSIADLAQFRPRLRKEAEGDTIKLALAIARRVLRREVAIDQDAMRGLVIAAIEKLHAQEIYRVRVSAGQSQAVAAVLRETASHVKIEVIPDPTLVTGSVIFETNHGNLDASVESQLHEIERGLADHLRKKS